MRPRVVVLDYGSGNLRSAERALRRAGADVEVSAESGPAVAADGLVVPGVGAFAACMHGLRLAHADLVVGERLVRGAPVLGVCVGMQVLFERGDEHGVVTEGLGELSGEVTRLVAPVLPHMGWNTVEVREGSTLFKGVEDERFYFVHSYAAKSAYAPVAWTVHGERFVAAVEDGPICATQFHPEKSGDAGAHLLENWLRTLR
jgi:glutamine amidotransferase